MPIDIVTKNGNGAPPDTSLRRGELAIDMATDPPELYTSTNGTDVVPIGSAAYSGGGGANGLSTAFVSWSNDNAGDANFWDFVVTINGGQVITMTGNSDAPAYKDSVVMERGYTAFTYRANSTAQFPLTFSVRKPGYSFACYGFSTDTVASSQREFDVIVDGRAGKYYSVAGVDTNRRVATNPVVFKDLTFDYVSGSSIIDFQLVGVFVPDVLS